MRAVSLRSLKSEGRSENAKSIASADNGVENADFDEFIQVSCKKFQCPVEITVGRETQRDALPPKSAKQRQESRSKRKMSQPVEAPSPQSVAYLNPFEDSNLLVMAIYDGLNQLVEILLSKYNDQVIPRVLMQMIAIKAPYTRHLAKFTIRQCRIDMYTIYELNKILLISNITDICLDHSWLKEGNYDLLLSESSSLRNLSLSRCHINDLVCERIATRLRHLEPAETTLLTLNLSSNHITDEGMKYLGEALRSNRHLRYLNVSDNHISDVGAQYIFDVLKEFPLTMDETLDKGRCYVKYLKAKAELYTKYMNKFEEEYANRKLTGKKSATGKYKSSAKKDKVLHNIRRDSHHSSTSDEYLSMKARSMVLEILGPFKHPFSPAVVTVKDSRLYCIGNLTLCYLNLRYNNLTFQSVDALMAVINHQKMYRTEKLCGLMHVLMEGNYVPEDCIEYKLIKKELIRSMSRKKTGDKTIPASR